MPECRSGAARAAWAPGRRRPRRSRRNGPLRSCSRNLPSSFATSLPTEAVRPAEVDRDRQEQQPRPPVDRVEVERLPVADQIADQPDEEPEQRHGLSLPRPTRSTQRPYTRITTP